MQIFGQRMAHTNRNVEETSLCNVLYLNKTVISTWSKGVTWTNSIPSNTLLSSEVSPSLPAKDCTYGSPLKSIPKATCCSVVMVTHVHVVMRHLANLTDNLAKLGKSLS